MAKVIQKISIEKIEYVNFSTIETPPVSTKESRVITQRILHNRISQLTSIDTGYHWNEFRTMDQRSFKAKDLRSEREWATACSLFRSLHNVILLHLRQLISLITTKFLNHSSGVFI